MDNKDPALTEGQVTPPLEEETASEEAMADGKPTTKPTTDGSNEAEETPVADEAEETPAEGKAEGKAEEKPAEDKAEESDKKEQVNNEILGKKEKIAALKARLNEIDAEKETWFKKKEEYGKGILELIKDVRSAKSERDEYTKKVREVKAERQDHSQVLKDNIAEVKKLKDKLKSVSKGNKSDPIAIKKQIDSLQSKVETEVMSFEAEKRMMKKIKELEKEFEGSKGVMVIWEQIRAKSKEIDELKKQTNVSHKQVQDQAKMSQQRHEDMIKNSNQIDEMKKKEEEAYKSFFECKQRFIEVNNELKNLLGDLNQVSKKADKIRAESRKEKRKQENNVLKDREAEINQKMKNNKKLTTEDLLTLQQIELRKRK